MINSPGIALGQNNSLPVLAYWRFENNSLDSSGNGHHLTLGANPVFIADKSPSAPGSSCIAFTGGPYALSSIQGPHSNFSVEFFFKTIQSTGTRFLVTTFDHTNLDGDGTGGWKIYLFNGQVRFEVRNEGQANALSILNSASSDYANGLWHHVVATYSASGFLQLYVNGVLQAHRQHGVAFADQDRNPILIGKAWIGGFDFEYTGRIDEVRLTGKVLDPTEFLTATPPAPAPEPPVLGSTPAGPILIFNGQSTVLAITASGTSPLAYQWFKDGIPIPGATEPNLLLTGYCGDSAEYHVRVTNAAGGADSPPIRVIVLPENYLGDLHAHFIASVTEAIGGLASRETLEILRNDLIAFVELSIGSRSSQQTVDALHTFLTDRLDGTLSSLATRSSIDVLAGLISAIDLTPIEQLVGSRASQTAVESVAALLVQLDALINARLNTPVGTRASQISVDALEAKLDALRDDLDSRASQASLDNLQTRLDQSIADSNHATDLLLRAQIERHLSDPAQKRVSLFYLPAARGGQLEFVRQIVAETIQTNRATGIDVTQAQRDFDRAEQELARQDYKRAYDHYAKAYQAVVR